jgi:uncharacterized membrane protein
LGAASRTGGRREAAVNDRETAQRQPSFEEYPLTRNEYIGALVHFYRGERSRADAWRSRLDPTTNWAVVTTGGMLSFAFSTSDHPAVVLLLANLLILIFLGFEARRFRYFDVWRARVRMVEENFFIPIIRRNLISPRSDWREFVAEDLDHPTFKISFPEAVAIRLRANYIWLFLVILVAYVTKLAIHPTPATRLPELYARLAVGPVPAWLMLLGVVAFYAAAVWMALWAGSLRGGGDEVHGLEKAIEHWKA